MCMNGMKPTHLLNAHFLQCPLQKFPVLDVLVFLFGGKFDPLYSYCAREQHVQELAVSSTCREGRGGEGMGGEGRGGRINCDQ